MQTKNKIKLAIVTTWIVAFISSVIWNSSAPIESRIPFIPVVDISINGQELPVIKSTEVVTSTTLIKELRDLGVLGPINLADRSYSIPEHDDFVELTHWMNRFYWSTPKLRYFYEAYDCDNFARTLVVLADFAFVPNIDQKKDNSQLSAMRIYVKQEHKWGGVPAGGYHALVLVRTSRGWFAHEPQSGALEKFEKYPNRTHVFNVNGD